MSLGSDKGHTFEDNDDVYIFAVLLLKKSKGTSEVIFTINNVRLYSIK